MCLCFPPSAVAVLFVDSALVASNLIRLFQDLLPIEDLKTNFSFDLENASLSAVGTFEKLSHNRAPYKKLSC